DYNMASVRSGRFVGYYDTINCGGWTETTYNSVGTPTPAFGHVVVPAGTQSMECSTPLPPARCSTPYPGSVARFSPPPTGNTGGRAGMHFVCATKFAGSHLCHWAEYVRAAGTTSPPASGAWIDVSGFYDQNGTYSIDYNMANGESGRFLGAYDTINCANWS